MTYEKLFRSNIRRLTDAYLPHAPTQNIPTLSRQMFGDEGILRMGYDNDRTFGVHIYDRVVATFQARWPEGVAWPEGVERVDPDQVRKPVLRGARRPKEPAPPRPPRPSVASLQRQIEELRQRMAG